MNHIIFVLGIDVHVVVDCCSSRSMTDRKFALERLRDVGAFLTTSECVILGLAPDAAHPKFKQISCHYYGNTCRISKTIQGPNLLPGMKCG